MLLRYFLRGFGFDPAFVDEAARARGRAFATFVAARFTVAFTVPAAAVTDLVVVLAVVLPDARDAPVAALDAVFAAGRADGLAAAFDADGDAVLEAALAVPFDVALAAGFAAFAVAPGLVDDLVLVFGPALDAGFEVLAGFLAAGLALVLAGVLAALRVPAGFVELLGVLAMIVDPPDAETHRITVVDDCPSTTKGAAQSGSRDLSRVQRGWTGLEEPKQEP